MKWPIKKVVKVTYEFSINAENQESFNEAVKYLIAQPTDSLVGGSATTTYCVTRKKKPAKVVKAQTD